MPRPFFGKGSELKITCTRKPDTGSKKAGRGLALSIDAMLIKPIQRMTRYLLFLTSLTSTCSKLGYQSAVLDLSSALEVMRGTVSHTNTLTWVGGMHCCPLDLSALGLLLKSGTVREGSGEHCFNSSLYAGVGNLLVVPKIKEFSSAVSCNDFLINHYC